MDLEHKDSPIPLSLRDIPLSQGGYCLFNDTIGFIKDLPPELIAAFTSTLEDSVESDILLHVIDAGDPWIEEKIQIVDSTLESIGAKQPRWYIFNKSDTLTSEEKREKSIVYKSLNPTFLSAQDGSGLADLRARIIRECF